MSLVVCNMTKVPAYGWGYIKGYCLRLGLCQGSPTVGVVSRLVGHIYSIVFSEFGPENLELRRSMSLQ